MRVRVVTHQDESDGRLRYPGEQTTIPQDSLLPEGLEMPANAVEFGGVPHLRDERGFATATFRRANPERFWRFDEP